MIESQPCTARADSTQRRAIILTSALVLLWSHSQPARADMVLVSQTELVMGTLSESIALMTPSAGTVDVTLSDLAWPIKLSSLSFSATTASGVIASGSVPASSSSYATTFLATGPVAFYAHIAAVAQSLGVAGLPALGLESLQVDFTPQGAPVPLPASGWLLLAGLSAAIAAALRLNGLEPGKTGALPAAGH